MRGLPVLAHPSKLFKKRPKHHVRGAPSAKAPVVHSDASGRIGEPLTIFAGTPLPDLIPQLCQARKPLTLVANLIYHTMSAVEFLDWRQGTTSNEDVLAAKVQVYRSQVFSGLTRLFEGSHPQDFAVHAFRVLNPKVWSQVSPHIRDFQLRELFEVAEDPVIRFIQKRPSAVLALASDSLLQEISPRPFVRLVNDYDLRLPISTWGLDLVLTSLLNQTPKDPLGALKFLDRSGFLPLAWKDPLSPGSSYVLEDLLKTVLNLGHSSTKLASLSAFFHGLPSPLQAAFGASWSQRHPQTGEPLYSHWGNVWQPPHVVPLALKASRCEVRASLTRVSSQPPKRSEEDKEYSLMIPPERIMFCQTQAQVSQAFTEIQGLPDGFCGINLSFYLTEFEGQRETSLVGLVLPNLAVVICVHPDAHQPLYFEMVHMLLREVLEKPKFTKLVFDRVFNLKVPLAHLGWDFEIDNLIDLSLRRIQRLVVPLGPKLVDGEYWQEGGQLVEEVKFLGGCLSVEELADRFLHKRLRKFKHIKKTSDFGSRPLSNRLIYSNVEETHLLVLLEEELRRQGVYPAQAGGA